jgi:FtsZ-binding cell division protein ZapB
MEYRVDRHGDTTVTIRQININNIKEWDNMMEKRSSEVSRRGIGTEANQIFEESKSPLS